MTDDRCFCPAVLLFHCFRGAHTTTQNTRTTISFVRKTKKNGSCRCSTMRRQTTVAAECWIFFFFNIFYPNDFHIIISRFVLHVMEERGKKRYEMVYHWSAETEHIFFNMAASKIFVCVLFLSFLLMMTVKQLRLVQKGQRRGMCLRVSVCVELARARKAPKNIKGAVWS